MMNGLQTLPQWRDYFDSPDSALLGTINAVYPIGKIIALFPCTWLSDRYGRKTPMFAGFIFLVVGAALQGAAQNLPMFIISRLMLGAATALIAQPSPILITELAYPTQRGQITALYNTFYVSLSRLVSVVKSLTLRSIWAPLWPRGLHTAPLNSSRHGLGESRRFYKELSPLSSLPSSTGSPSLQGKFAIRRF